jgi:hypothetical protein
MIISKFKGIQNTSSNRDIDDEALQDAVNVDITNDGGIVAREDTALILSLPVTTAYSTFGDTCYIVSGGRLLRVDPGLSTADLAASTATAFADYQEVLFTNDGLKVHGGQVVDLKVPVPSQPEIVITGGSWPAGQYSIITTYTSVDGLEGGTSPVVVVRLDAPGAILITPAPLDGFTANVYITDPDGDVFFNMATGYRLVPAQLNANPFPERANKIEYHESRLYVTEDHPDHTVVYYSDPLLFHLYGVDDAYFVIPGRILDMRSTPQGLVIGTLTGIYVYESEGLALVAEYGVIPGRSMVRLPDRSLLIHTVRGVAKALPFQELTGSQVSLPMGENCNTQIVYSNGVMKYVATHDGLGTAYNKFTN